MRDGQAVKEAPLPVAWAYWISWRGPPELVAHIARRAIWAVGSTDEERHEATCKIEVFVGADVEEMKDPDQLLDRVTEDALRKFSMIAIDVRGARGSVLIEMARKRMKERGPPRAGVLVTAISHMDAADELRETVARAVERRASRALRWYGGLQDPIGVRAAVAEARRSDPPTYVESGAGRVSVRWDRKWVLILFWVLIALIVGFLAWSEGAAVALPVSAVVGAVAGPLFFVLRPDVEVQAVTRLRRAATWFYRSVLGAIAAALISAGVAALFGGGNG
jgi:hypothetical protein